MEVEMSGLLKTIEALAVVAALVAGGLAIWNRRDKVKETLDSLGGVEGIANTAGRLAENAGPVRDFVNQLTHLK
ncbi:MAG: hypothetical protein GX630_07355 [Actinobacteria bacterium]|nr:hypothetical protein [Actinomycetota bacterium]